MAAREDHAMTPSTNGTYSGPLVVDDPGRGRFKVHRSTMTSAEILHRERDVIFNRCWLYLGHESELHGPGSFKTRTVAGRPLIFARDESGEVRAFLNSCPHRGAQVCREREGCAKRFTCFYHGWTYSNSGELLAIPGDEAYGPEFDRADLGLGEAPRLDSYRGFVFVNFDRGAVDLVTYLAGAAEYLDLVADQSPDGMEVVGGTQEYSMRANWKLLVENSIDGYHALTTHATYFTYLKDLGTDLSMGVSGTARQLGNGHGVIEYLAPWGRPIARWEPRWGEEVRRDLERLRAELFARVGEERGRRIAERNRNMAIFPNLVVNDIMSITIRTFEPVSPDYMRVSAWSLAPRGEAPELRARRLDSFLTFLGPGGFATPDDVEALEVCQRGFATWRELEWSDISRGMTREAPGANDELQMRSFWRRWNELVTGAPAAAETRPAPAGARQ
jgi:p-cumate 2,3-dioxygenase alpha subunit